MIKTAQVRAGNNKRDVTGERFAEMGAVKARDRRCDGTPATLSDARSVGFAFQGNH
jgi:hypothetical protein